MSILDVFVNLWAVITVYTFYSVFIYVTIRDECQYLLLHLIIYVLFILYCKTHSTLLILDNYFSSTFLWHFRFVSFTLGLFSLFWSTH